MAKGKFNRFEFYQFVMTMLSLTLNIVTVLLVARKFRIKRMLRQYDYLVVYVSMTAIVAASTGMLSLFGRGVWLTGDLACPTTAFISMVLINVFPAGVLALNYDRMKSLLRMSSSSAHPDLIVSSSSVVTSTRVHFLLIFAWGISILTAIPHFFTTAYNAKKFECYKAKLYKLRRMLPSMLKKNADGTPHLLRFVCINSIAFVVTWLPFGVILTVYEHVRSLDADNFPMTNFSLWVILSAYLVALPLTIFGTTKDLTKRIFLGRRGRHAVGLGIVRQRRVTYLRESRV
ncbi:hypothetical protein Fcan01_10820 [Folsomia candida]|uniref:G-protein coupled receptors family 1 profile domain-containing protein n=1 Tax=Folsomia candida TaxID=158441 RepID=A0A226E9U6_FOLCA|nr:hypothetical protein Fcan01_10820 [Folsomia candida]